MQSLPCNDHFVADSHVKQLVVGAVAQKIGSNATETDIEVALNNICSKLGGFAGVCKDFVTKYTPEIIATLVDDLNATSVCIKIGLCPKSIEEVKPSPVECTLCKVFFDYVFCFPTDDCQLAVGHAVKNLTSNSTEKEIEDDLIKACEKLGAFAQVCVDFVNKYTPELIAAIAKDLNATIVCTKLKFCNATTDNTASPQKVALDSAAS